VDLPARVGRYEIELLLGEGAMGRVLLAHDPVLGRQVAIKVLRDDLINQPAARAALVERVRQDARGAATISHPGLAAIYDMGHDERFGVYVVFELVRGPTLRERVYDGPLPPNEVAAIGRAIGAALSYAHGAGLMHRGVKPENVMLAPTGPKLTDLGFCEADPRAPAYVSPEFLASGTSGAASDQFALAATLYEALTGRRAFPGDDPNAVATAVAAAKIASAKAAVPALRGFLRLDRVLTRGMAAKPADRFPSCEAFATAFSAELEGPRVTFLATPGPMRTSISRATRKRQNVIALAAVSVIFVLILIGRIRQHAGEDKSSTSMQRVAPPPVAAPQPPRPTPFAHPTPSATSPLSISSGAAGKPPASALGPIVDP
jgi:serine/threonine-protein kinase